MKPPDAQAKSRSADSSSSYSSHSSSEEAEDDLPQKKSSSSTNDKLSNEDIDELKDDVHFVTAMIKWFNCDKKHKKTLLQGIKKAFSECAPAIYKHETTPPGDSAPQMPDIDKFFDQYDVNDFGSEFTISVDAYKPTLCKVRWVWTKPAEVPQRATQPEKYNREAAMARQAELQQSEEYWRARSQIEKGAGVICMADCEPVFYLPAGHYA